VRGRRANLPPEENLLGQGADSIALELVDYGTGYAWLQPEPQPDPEDSRYDLTDAGHDYLARERAMHALWPRPTS